MLRSATALYTLDLCGEANSAVSDREDWPTYGCKHGLDNFDSDLAIVLRAIRQSD
jgi:hypothetical protein